MDTEKLENLIKQENEETRRRFDQKAAEMGQHFDEQAAETQRRFDQKAAEMGQHFDEQAAETRRHFDVVAENLRSEIQVVAEGVLANTERLDRVDARLDKVETRLGRLEIKVEVLDQKVDAFIGETRTSFEEVRA
jgi:exonuclease VII large subunit